MTFQIRPFFLQKTNLNRTRETNFNLNLTLEFFIFQSRFFDLRFLEPILI